MQIQPPLMIHDAEASMIRAFFSALAGQRSSFPFLLVHGRPHIGKTSLIEQEVRQLLGEFFLTDYAPLYDFSEKLEKEQSLKVETERSEELIEIDGQTYRQRGMRELSHRLSLAPLGARKVVYLENIERMTGAAANMLLKSFEEPLPGRVIIASTSSLDSVLDTIRSRAFIVPMRPLDIQTLETSLATAYPTIDAKQRQFAVSFSLGARGVATRLLNDPEIASRATHFDEIKQRLLSPGRIDEQMSRVSRFFDQGAGKQLLDALLYLATYDSSLIHHIPSLVQLKQGLETNVNEDHLLFQWCLHGAERI